MGLQLHHRLQALGDRRLAAADGTQQVEDLLLFLEALRGMLEERDDLLDRVLHAVELLERRIAPDRRGCRRGGRAVNRCACRRAPASPMPASMRSAAVAYTDGSVGKGRGTRRATALLPASPSSWSGTYRAAVPIASPDRERRAVPVTIVVVGPDNARTLAAWFLIHYIPRFYFRKARANFVLALAASSSAEACVARTCSRVRQRLHAIPAGLPRASPTSSRSTAAPAISQRDERPSLNPMSATQRRADAS